MGLFDKVAKAAGSIGNSVANSAAKVGSSVVVTSKEQSELVSLKSQINVINQELNAAYAQIGKKYVDYVIETSEMPGIDVSDILKIMEPKLEKKQELEAEIIRIEKEIKSKNVLREKQQAEAEFTKEKDKLDKALAMDLLSNEEYEAKIAAARLRVDNFEAIRKIEQQADMGLITSEEKKQKINALLG